MKSKITIMASMLFTVLMLVNSASAQGRAEKVSLPCQVHKTVKYGPVLPNGSKPSTITLDAKIQNNTGTWLAEGRTIYYQLKIMQDGDLGPTYTTVLSEMVPDGSYAQIWETVAPSFNQISSYPYCVAWYLK